MNLKSKLPDGYEGNMFLHRCEGCGERFIAARSHARTCSPRCRQRISRSAKGAKA